MGAETLGRFDLVALDATADCDPLKITPTSAGGAVLLHTGSSDGDKLDFVRLYANNVDSADVSITLLVGGVTEPDDIVLGPHLVSARAGLVVLLPDVPLGTSKTLKAYASVADKLTLTGYVKRMTVG